MTDKYGPWFEERIRSFSPEHAAGNIGATNSIEQLTYAWRGLSGESSSVFGMAVPESWGECDIPATKERIISTINQWLTVLPPDEAAEAYQRLTSWKVPVVAPSGLPEPVPPAEVAAHEPYDTTDLLERVASSQELVSRERWMRFAKGLYGFADAVRGHPACTITTELQFLPPLEPNQLVAAQAALDCAIPAEVLCIGSQFSSGIYFEFEWDMRGRPGFSGLSPRFLERTGRREDGLLFDLANSHELLGMRDWAPEGETGAWTSAFPLLSSDSDYVGLVDGAEGVNVLFFGHEEAHAIDDGDRAPFALRFLTFLEHWLALGLLEINDAAYLPSPFEEDNAFVSSAFRLQWRRAIRDEFGFSFDPVQ